jgi:hypothetical protein
MLVLSARRTATRAIGFAAALAFFADPSLPSLAQQPAGKSGSGAPAIVVDDASAAAIAAEGELKATIRTFQGDNPSAVFRYYWWRDSCYVRYQSGKYEPVSSDYCHR